MWKQIYFVHNCKEELKFEIFLFKYDIIMRVLQDTIYFVFLTLIIKNTFVQFAVTFNFNYRTKLGLGYDEAKFNY